MKRFGFLPDWGKEIPGYNAWNTTLPIPLEPPVMEPEKEHLIVPDGTAQPPFCLNFVCSPRRMKVSVSKQVGECNASEHPGYKTFPIALWRCEDGDTIFVRRGNHTWLGRTKVRQKPLFHLQTNATNSPSPTADRRFFVWCVSTLEQSV